MYHIFAYFEKPSTPGNCQLDSVEWGKKWIYDCGMRKIIHITTLFVLSITLLLAPAITADGYYGAYGYVDNTYIPPSPAAAPLSTSYYQYYQYYYPYSYYPAGYGTASAYYYPYYNYYSYSGYQYPRYNHTTYNNYTYNNYYTYSGQRSYNDYGNYQNSYCYSPVPDGYLGNDCMYAYNY